MRILVTNGRCHRLNVPEKILNVIVAFLLRVNRVGHVNRCLAMSEEIIAMLRSLIGMLGKPV